jgi:adenylate cyclase
LDMVRVKGKNEPVKLFELIASHSELDPILKESAEAYERGFELYLKKDFDKAILTLNEAIKIKSKKFGKDKAAYMLIGRCEEYKESPPDADWDGVFTRTHK